MGPRGLATDLDGRVRGSSPRCARRVGYLRPGNVVGGDGGDGYAGTNIDLKNRLKNITVVLKNIMCILKNVTFITEH